MPFLGALLARSLRVFLGCTHKLNWVSHQQTSMQQVVNIVSNRLPTQYTAHNAETVSNQQWMLTCQGVVAFGLSQASLQSSNTGKVDTSLGDLVHQCKQNGMVSIELNACSGS